MRQLILAAASIAALALAGPASAQSPIVIKFSHVVAELDNDRRLRRRRSSQSQRRDRYRSQDQLTHGSSQ